MMELAVMGILASLFVTVLFIAYEIFSRRHTELEGPTARPKIRLLKKPENKRRNDNGMKGPVSRVKTLHQKCLNSPFKIGSCRSAKVWG